MRFKLFILFCLFELILVGFTKITVTFELTGRLKNGAGNHQRVGNIPVFVRGYSEVLDQDTTNSKGIFHLTWNESRGKYFYFYCIVKKDTILLAKKYRFESDQPDLTFILPAH